MYKHQGSYYLMAAEGGTGVTHSVVIAISCLAEPIGEDRIDLSGRRLQMVALRHFEWFEQDY